MNSTSDSSEFY